MNRIERRIAGTNAGRPGAPVCNPGKPGSNVGMLGGSAGFYQTPEQRAKMLNQTKKINGLENGSTILIILEEVVSLI